jgi:CDP-glycerol glycerophosphotransferase (TagB/SpsB family)
LSQQDVLVTGNPRIDQFDRPVGDHELDALGIDSGMPLVLWLPTYRETSYTSRRIGDPRNWSDTHVLSDSPVVQSMLRQVADLARQSGVQLIVKPHPLDADQFHALGLRVVTGSDLRRAHVQLYRLLARAQGLVTDYSSVWTDFLVLDRPVAFFCPDLDMYVAGRGLNVGDYPSLLPGPLLDTSEDFQNFFSTCLHETSSSSARRRALTNRLGVEVRTGATKRLLDAVGVPRVS